MWFLTFTICILYNRYTPQCVSLIAKYKTTMTFLSESVANLETFMNDYKVYIHIIMIFFRETDIYNPASNANDGGRISCVP